MTDESPNQKLKYFEQYYEKASKLDITSILKGGLDSDQFSGLNDLISNSLTPEQSGRLQELFSSGITEATDLGLGTWKLRLLELNEAERDELDKLSTSLAEQLDLMVEISGSEIAIENNLSALQNIEPEKMEETIIKMLTPKSNAQIGKTAAFGFLLMLQRNSGDGNEWLLAAATLGKVIEREAHNISSEIIADPKPVNVSKTLTNIFRPIYKADSPDNLPAQVMISLVNKSKA